MPRKRTISTLSQAVLACSAVFLTAGPDVRSGVPQAMAQAQFDPARPRQGFGRPQRQQARPPNPAAVATEQANAATVGIVTARSAQGVMTQATIDLSTVLDRGEQYKDLRIVPIISRGKIQNLWDLMYLRGVDVGFLQTDTLEAIRTDPQFARIRGNIRYIATMFPEEVHIIARPEIRTLNDLAGKTISVNLKETGAALTMPLILNRLGVRAILEHEGDAAAFARMRQGTLAAHVIVFSKPYKNVADLKPGEFRILSIPDSPEINSLYLPAQFTNNDYPNLIGPNEEIETVAVGNVLAAFEWPQASERSRRIAKFTEAFFSKFRDLTRPEFEGRWRDVNIGAEVSGWIRLRAADDWLRRFARSSPGVGAARPSEDFNASTAQDRQRMREEFARFLQQRGSQPGSSQGRSSEGAGDSPELRLFEEFLLWKRENRS